MSYASEFTPVFLKLLGKLSKENKNRILTAFEEILSNPRKGSQLVFAKQVCFKWRIGDYRVICKIDETTKTVTFIVVDHRSRVYNRY